MKSLIPILILSLASISLSLAQGHQTSEIDESGHVQIDFTTVTENGHYSPLNVVAVWITDASGNFVRTLKKMGEYEDYYLFKWKLNTLGNTNDAITGATLLSHQTHNLVWDCKDHEGSFVADGNYQLHLEYTDKNAQGPFTHINFTKGDTNTIAPADLDYFKAISVKYYLGDNSIHPLKNEISFKLFPNPSTDVIYIQSSNIEFNRIQIIDIKGQVVKETDKPVQKLDISDLKNGIYYIIAKSKQDTGFQKFVKL